MFGFHWVELLIVLGIALIVFGPKRLPEIGSSMGRAIRDFRNGIHETQEETGHNEIHSLPNEVTTEVHSSFTSSAVPQNGSATEPVAVAAPPPDPATVGGA
jgi:sec-independent protein translocase protein TatA